MTTRKARLTISLVELFAAFIELLMSLVELLASKAALLMSLVELFASKVELLMSSVELLMSKVAVTSVCSSYLERASAASTVGVRRSVRRMRVFFVWWVFVGIVWQCLP